MHRQGHVHLPVRELRERVLHSLRQRLAGRDAGLDGVVVVQLRSGQARLGGVVRERLGARGDASERLHHVAPDGRVLRPRARQVAHDELLPLAALPLAVDYLTDFGVDALLGHRTSRDGASELAHARALCGNVRHHLRFAHHLGRDLVFGGLVASGGDDERVRAKPIEIEDPLTTGGLGEDDVGVTHGILRGGAGGEGVAELGGHLVAKRRVLDHVARVRVGLLEAVHGGGRTSHGLGDDARADESHALRPLHRQMLHRHSPRRARSHVRQVPVLVQHGLGRAVRRVAHHKHARPRGQALLDVLVEAHVGQLHRPRWSALDVPALDVAVAGTRGGRLGDADVHRQGHVHLPARELQERVLHRQHELLRRFDVVHDGVVVEQHGRREFLRTLRRAVPLRLAEHHPRVLPLGRPSFRTVGPRADDGLRLGEIHRVLLRQRRVQILRHLRARQLARNVHLHGVRVLLQPRALVIDLLDGGAHERDGGAQARDAAGTIGHHTAEADESSVVDEAALEDVAEG